MSSRPLSLTSALSASSGPAEALEVGLRRQHQHAASQRSTLAAVFTYPFHLKQDHSSACWADGADLLIAYLNESEDAHDSDMPNPILLAYATTKDAIQNCTDGLAQMLAEKGIRVNAVAPGPIWTPLIPSTMPEEAVTNLASKFR